MARTVGALLALWHDRQGGTAIEYAIVGAMVAVGAIGALVALGDGVSALYDEVGTQVVPALAP